MSFPGSQDWQAILRPPEASIAMPQQRLVLPASMTGRALSQGMPGPIVRVDTSGTATGLKGRTSAQPVISLDPVTVLRPGDAEWAARGYRFQSNGTNKPQDMGYTPIGPGGYTETPNANGIFRLDTDGSGYRYYRINPADAPVLNLNGGIGMRVWHWAWAWHAGHESYQNLYIQEPHGSWYFQLHGTDYGANVGRIFNYWAGEYLNVPAAAQDQLWDLYLVTRYTGGTVYNPGGTQLLARPRGSYGAGTLVGLADYGAPGRNSIETTPGFFNFGESVGFKRTAMSWEFCGVYEFPVACDEYGFEALTNGQTSFQRNQSNWYFDLGSNGYYDAFGAPTSLAQPAAPSGQTIAPVGSTSLTVKANAVGGVPAYRITLRLASDDSVVGEPWEGPDPFYTFVGLAVNTYYADVQSKSASGILSNPASTADQVLPAYVHPSANLTVNGQHDHFADEGDTITLAWTTTGIDLSEPGHTMTLAQVVNGVTTPLDPPETENGSRVITGLVAGDHRHYHLTATNPVGEAPAGANVTLRGGAAPGRPGRPAWISGVLTVYPAAAGVGTRQWLRLMKWDKAARLWIEDADNDPADYEAMFGLGQLSSTAHGWTVDAGERYAVVCEDDGGRRSLLSAAFWGSSAEDLAVCAVVFDGDDSLADEVVTARPTVGFTLGGQVFVETLTVTLDNQGRGELVLGRSDAGSPMLGTLAPHYAFTVKGQQYERRVPSNAAEALFTELLPV